MNNFYKLIFVLFDKNYYHLIVIFDKNMNLLRYCKPFKFKGERVEYCTGLIVETDRIIMTYSIWDCTTYISTYNHNNLPHFTNFIETQEMSLIDQIRDENLLKLTGE